MHISIYLLLIFILGLESCSSPVTADSTTPDHGSVAENATVKDDTGKLYIALQHCDSLLFTIGFNTIDTAQIAQLIADDFEFYHDEHGMMETKADFVSSIASLRDLPFKTWRELQPGSMEVFPMYRNNKSEIYGVVQTGIHEFYQQKAGEEARKTSTARFCHLWVLESGEWKLKRVFSFDHH